MARPITTEEALKALKRKTVDGPEHTALLEAYKKHVAELSAIEDRQNKLFILLLGILSAAATLLAKENTSLGNAKWYIGPIAILVVMVGNHSNNELHDLRIAVRDLLVRCEIALGYYAPGTFLLREEPLYTDYERKYAYRGGWQLWAFAVVWFALLGFLVVLLRPYELGGREEVFAISLMILVMLVALGWLLVRNFGLWPTAKKGGK